MTVASDHTERLIIEIALINAAIFYALVVIVFLIARKDRLNYALATQKVFWFTIVVSTYALLEWRYRLPQLIRIGMWVGLSIATWWVFAEVFMYYRGQLHDWWLRHRLW